MNPEDENGERGSASDGAEPHFVTRTYYRSNVLAPFRDDAARRQYHHTVAQIAAAEFKVTGNPVFAWGAVQACLASSIEPLPLPPEVRSYLHDAATKIVDAATEHHEAFAATVLKALAFAGKQGASRARDYAKLQGQEYLIGIYNALKERHGSARAEHMIAEAVRITPDRVRARLGEARRTRVRVRKEAFGDAGTQYRLGAQVSPELPDALLLNLASGLPDLFWKWHQRPKRAKPRPK